MQNSLQKLKQILLPSPLQIVMSVVASTAVMVVVYRDLLQAKLISYIELAQLPSNASFFGRLQRLADSTIGHNAVIIIFWSIVGLVAYSLVWTLVNIGIEARNEMVIETTYTNKGSIGDRFLGVSTQIIIGLVLVAFVIISAVFFLPLWSSLFGVLVTARFSLLSLLSGVIALTATALNLYLIYIFLQMFFISG